MHCTVCHGRDVELEAVGPLARCRSCGYLFVPRTPDLPGQIAALYAGAYFTGAEFGDYESQRPTFARNFRDYLRRMRDAGATNGRLLEVGCAYGFFLEQAQTSFDAVGLDVNTTAIDAAKRLGTQAHCVEFLEFEPSRLFDVVCMWDTIEHVLEPRAYLEKARDLLPAGGHLFLTTGDIGSLVARLRGPRWRMIHPPSHLNYFSRLTMTRLLNDIGFEVHSIRAVGTRRDLLNTMHLLALFSKTGIVKKAAGMLERAWPRRLPSISLYANLHDIMFVAARKAETE
jgi:SAM-dependent methyltransferase